MPRQARIYYPGGVFHVISRFMDGKRFLRTEKDRAHYVGLIGNALQRCDTEVLAYCLMSTHIHLVVIHGKDPIARLTKSLHVGFAQYVNRKKSRKGAQGAVFAERPKMFVVDKEEYLTELVRYVHNNPVRAGVVERAIDSSWSSHRAYVGEVEAPSWLRMGYVLDWFGKRKQTARKHFEIFVQEGEEETRREDFSGRRLDVTKGTRRVFSDGNRLTDGILGDDAFVKRVLQDSVAAQTAFDTLGFYVDKKELQKKRPRLQKVLAAVCAEVGIELNDFEARPKSRKGILARKLLVWMWVKEYGGRQVDIVTELGVTSQMVSRWYSRAIEHAAIMDGHSSQVLRLAPLKMGRKKTKRRKLQYRVDFNE